MHSIPIAFFIALAACRSSPEADDATLPVDTASDTPFPTPERIIETRPDLTACSERTEPVVESYSADVYSYWEHEAIPLCPSDQLSVYLFVPGWADSVEVIPAGSLEGLELVHYDRNGGVIVPPLADRWSLVAPDQDPCDTWQLPLLVRSGTDAAPTTFDVRFIDSGERCPSTD